MSVPVTATYVILANVVLARTNEDYNHDDFDTQIYQIAIGSYVNGTAKMEILDRKISPVRSWIVANSTFIKEYNANSEIAFFVTVQTSGWRIPNYWFEYAKI